MITLWELPDRMAGLRGGRRGLVALLLGASLAAALPPFHALPAALVSLTGLVWLLDGAADARRAWFDGWAFGAGFGAAGLYWIANALLVDAARFGWLVPLALAALAAGFGLFPACACVLAQRVRPGVPRILAFAAAWIAIEWVRSWLLTGFPWNLLGTAFAFSTELLQAAAWGGPWLLSALLLAVALAPAMAVAALPRRRRQALPVGLGASLALLALLWGLGALRLAAHPVAVREGITLRLVQPAIEQRLKWRPELRDAHFATHVALSLSPSATAPTAVIWPEAAIPWSLLAAPERRAEAASPLSGDAVLLAGAIRWRRDAAGESRPLNALVALDRRGDIAAGYDKRHLVPFGEYVPLRRLLPLDKLTPGLVDFAAGRSTRALRVGALPPLRALICFEAIFPAEIRGDGAPPAWLLNVTNDAWYGVSSGPYQHFTAARLRAVEQGLPLVRVANNGISGVIDPLGRVLVFLPLDAVGALDAPLPRPLASSTLYARWGDGTLPLSLLPLLVALAWRLRGKARR